ncbi:radical SAM family RiPP maturation amino acid epimerase [Aetokthonos hydrillicola Thurmond2011]|jgi:radical SAM family RiPP maturation amino acid epimerase|uniref:Radical SAM family RiPP maturation amino acid epimerase n=1 Tax=Aetokthonos hydrillicola Thurmond2011 TaxID=2712845 RepID=A0AAP5M6H1_9CYAN|nr:radical SAM family RiPP maturation amino acid epimerase [Aetokthonos hydrillicola]MBO3458689.1 radical SAM family RiPP maturation amino acid epimerase [Aetokthonos hydrillicola CCALA 1050]MBW4588042.1 radical SAM family RiPP maturation amino acid epimerase [Aetokthonos hydrillicola CCALA 1050]MDR9897006.1 radical SAM family RiPP maturation amino acid epimerase [Aetokthonos hydrillicola Thurmond2011]
MQVKDITLYRKISLKIYNKIEEIIKNKQNNETFCIENISHGELEKLVTNISHLKRFREKLEANPSFREQFLADPDKTIESSNLSIESSDIDFLWQDMMAHKEAEYLPTLPSERYLKLFKEENCDVVTLADSSSNPYFKAWRSRQIARCTSQMPKPISDGIVHASVSFELSKGCSVGCWFCGVSAPRLGDIFTYSPENAKLWREILELFQDLYGAAAKSGFCYWATDPFDNPDYERFCIDFYNILGVFPSTTTAQALKDPTRTRNLLKLCLEKGFVKNRFSILSLKILDQLYKEFTPEELTFVDLALQNPENIFPKASAGRARERDLKKFEKSQEPLKDADQKTNACVSGFLLNLVERSVKLISPCNADEYWPNGYYIYEEGHFDNIDDLKMILQGMTARHMTLTVRDSDRMSFRRDLEYQSLSDGFQVSTKYKIHTFRSEIYLKYLGEIIHKGDKTVAEIIPMFSMFGIPKNYILDSLNIMFNDGVLDAEPISNGVQF